MTNDEFRAWLQGFFELSDEDAVLNPEQVQVIVNHLNLAETVSGKLDQPNQQLRDDISAFRSLPKPIAPELFESFTLDMRCKVLAHK